MSASLIRSRTFSEDTFLGNFTFSDLDSYQAGTPQTFRVNSGDPELINDQIEASAFVDTDLKLTRQFTAMFGIRYDWQTNLGDHNNVAPRAGFSYAMAFHCGSGRCGTLLFAFVQLDCRDSKEV